VSSALVKPSSSLQMPDCYCKQAMYVEQFIEAFRRGRHEVLVEKILFDHKKQRLALFRQVQERLWFLGLQLGNLVVLLVDLTFVVTNTLLLGLDVSL
jgi:hypothetical protein